MSDCDVTAMEIYMSQPHPDEYEEDVCGECEHNYQNEECELYGHEIYEDMTACDDFCPK